MKEIFDDLRDLYSDFWSKALQRLTECVRAHGGEYRHDVEKYGPIYVRCWNEDEDGVELYEVYGLRVNEPGYVVMDVTSHNGNAYLQVGEHFEKYADDLIEDYAVTIMEMMTDPE